MSKDITVPRKNEERQPRAGTPEVVSEIYGIPEGTLANMRYRKEGPRYFKQKRRVYYFFSDVETWMKRNPVLTTDTI